MLSNEITYHAATRMAQRGIAIDDVELIKLLGIEVESGYMVREKDFQELDRNLKYLRDRAKRLVGMRLVVDGSRVVTAYRANRNKKRWLIRNAEDRVLTD